MKKSPTNVSRRQFLAASGLALAGTLLPQSYAMESTPAAGFELAPLPYDLDALEPYIDAQTMDIHHGRHHAAYINNLNSALEKHPGLAPASLEELLSDISALPSDIRISVRNNGGGHFNHDLFWNIMSPDGGGEPVGEVADAIIGAFGSVDSFKSEFLRAAATRFGSGWGWLIVRSDGSLAITSTPNQDNPLMRNLVEQAGIPVLGIDVWEHAYYLHYQNRRGDYINAWWNVVNWGAVNRRYLEAVA